jgi:hypothetical protein
MKGCAVLARAVGFVAIPQLNCADPFGMRPISPTQSSLTRTFINRVATHPWCVDLAVFGVNREALKGEK